MPLREVLELGPLADARVVAGAAGLERRVRRVNVMEVPDILEWVRADELLLTTAYPLRDDRAALARLVPDLAERGLAGLALKPARYIDEIPPEMIAAADRLDFPLIELPPESSFNEIINGVLTVILNAQAARLQRAAEIHDRFTTIVLGGGGLRQIATALAGMIDRPVAIVDAGGRLQTVSPGTAGFGRLGSSLDLRLDRDEDGPTKATTGRLGEQRVTVQPIRVGDERFGAIVVLGDGDLVDERLDAIEYAATVTALRQVQARAVSESDRRFQAVCLEELVAGHVDRAVLMERAVAFAWNLSMPRAVVLAQVDELSGRPYAGLVGTAEETRIRRRLGDAVRTALGRQAIVWERSAEVAGLVAVPAADSSSGPPAGHFLAESGDRVLAEAQGALPEATVSVAIGGVRTDPLHLSESYAEARRALDVGRRLHGAGHVSLFDRLGVDRLLARLPEPELADFASGLLAPLDAHDRVHGTDLRGTLEAYLATRNAALAARRLFVHYNTMKNRLRTIEELVGPFLDDPERVLALGLALRIRRLPRG